MLVHLEWHSEARVSDACIGAEILVSSSTLPGSSAVYARLSCKDISMSHHAYLQSKEWLPARPYVHVMDKATLLTVVAVGPWLA